MPTDSPGAPDDAAEPTGPEPAPRHVLIVEDNHYLSELMEIWIREFYDDRTSVRVEHTIADGERALASLSTLDVVLLDRRFPDGSGEDLLESITNEFDAVAVVITGMIPEEEIIRLPIDDYIVKPVEEDVLVQRLSLLEKLDASGALGDYSDARKASLLEYHLDAPEENPLFRRFASRWSYDRLEIAQIDDAAAVYELYVGGASAETGEGEVSVSVAGSLEPDLRTLLESGDVEPEGELLPSGDGYAWIEADDVDPADRPPESIGIYGFACETPERHVDADGYRPDDADGIGRVELARILESGFN